MWKTLWVYTQGERATPPPVEARHIFDYLPPPVYKSGLLPSVSVCDGHRGAITHLTGILSVSSRCALLCFQMGTLATSIYGRQTKTAFVVGGCVIILGYGILTLPSKACEDFLFLGNLSCIIPHLLWKKNLTKKKRFSIAISRVWKRISTEHIKPSRARRCSVSRGRGALATCGRGRLAFMLAISIFFIACLFIHKSLNFAVLRACDGSNQNSFIVVPVRLTPRH